MDLIRCGVIKALAGKYRRDNYAAYIATFGNHTANQVKRLAKDLKYGVITPYDFAKEFETDVDRIAKDVRRQFLNKKLEIGEVRYEERLDKGTGKIRMLGIETPAQQVIEHVTVLAMDELWKKKFCFHQYSSIQGKGQVRGAKTIRKWARKGSIKYFVKCDIRKCFDNIVHKDVIKLLKRDIGKNKELIWLVSEILTRHNSPKSKPGSGLIIGSWLSSMLCNYMLSYSYRRVSELSYTRRSKRTRLVTHVLFFMDDMLLISNNKKLLKAAVRDLSQCLCCAFSLKVKQKWHVKDFSKEPITMMGFTIFCNGKMKIRRKNFIKVRRCYIRIANGRRSIKNCKSCSAYNGYFKNSDTQNVWLLPTQKLFIPEIQNRSSKVQSNFEKIRRTKYAESRKLRRVS